MKQKICKVVLMLIILAVTENLAAQDRIAYYDALYFSGLLKHQPKISTNDNTVAKMLRYYMGNDPSIDLQQEVIKNPFLSPYFDVNGEASFNLNSSGSVLNSFASKAGNLDVTNLADGLARFLVNRTKQELGSYFFDRFKEDLDSSRQLRILFPFTSQALGSIDKQIYNYSAYLNLLRDCFQKDLALLLPDLQKLVDDGCMDIVFKKNPELRTILADGLYLVTRLQARVHPGAVIHEYITYRAQRVKLDAVYLNLYPSFQTFDLVSQSLRSKQPNQYWLSADSLNLLFDSRDTATLRIYLGLICQQATKIIFNKNDTLSSKMKTMQLLFDSLKGHYQPYLTALVEKGKRVDESFNAILAYKAKGMEKPTYQDYFTFYDATLNLLDHVKSGTALVGITIPVNAEKKIDLFLYSARSLGNIYVDIYEKQYSSAIVEASGIFETLFHQKIADSIALLNIQLQARNSLLRTSTETAQVVIHNQIALLKKQKGVQEQFDQIGSLLMKYGGLAAAVVKAENSDEVEKAIEAIALPSGSSRVKRESRANVCLNGYVGMFAGNEYIKGAHNKFLNNYGIAAPVGISFSLGGIKGFSKHGNSLGLFVSVIDLGALASFRFKDDSTKTVPTIQLKDIVAPGIFFVWGIAHSPLSLAAGAQMGPLLREVKPSVNTYSNNYYWRFGVSLTVDIPLLNFYNRGK
ncbi:MAG: hypothetical protein WCK34_04515 [Bacteroidota bacterium]